jgi:hypothetical protein
MSRKPKLRRITLVDEIYLWRLEWSYRKTSEAGSYDTLYRLICYRDGFKHSAAIIHFTTWEDAVTGGPLHTGAPLDLNKPCGLRVKPESAGGNRQDHPLSQICRLASRG